MRIFLSYKREDADEVERLEQALKLRGVRPWRDVVDLRLGRPSEDEIRKAIRDETDGLLAYITPEFLKSSFIMQVELDEAWKKSQGDPDYLIIPVFRGIEIDDAEEVIKNKVGFSVKARNGVKIPATGGLKKLFAGRRSGGEDVQAALNEAAARTLINLWPSTAGGNAVDVAVHTYPYKLLDPPPLLDIEWSFVFDGEPPGPDVWASRLQPALASVREAITQGTSIRRIRLLTGLHLPAALAVGYEFRETSGFTIELNKAGTWWATDTPPSGNHGLQSNIATGATESKVLVVEVSVTNDVQPGTTATLAKHNIRERARLSLRMPQPSNSAVQDAAHAAAIAAAVRQEIIDARNKFGTHETHLFMSVPDALAMMIGHRLNAVGPVQCYHFHQPTLTYVPSLRLMWPA